MLDMYLNCQNKLILFCADIDTFFDSKKDDLIIEVTDDGKSTSTDQVILCVKLYHYC